MRGQGDDGNDRISIGRGRMMGQVNLLTGADLPEEIRGYLRAVMDTSGLEGEARLDVLRELVAHFEDGLAAGRSREELLSAFGDEVMAGRMIAYARRKDVRPVGHLATLRRKGEEAMTAIGRDLRVVLRSLRRNPTFAIVAVLTLALGIGANTAVFSVVNGVVLRPLPYPQPDRLLAMYMTDEEDGDLEVPWSVQSLRDVVETNGSFSSITGWQWEDVTLTGLGDPELVYAVGVTDGMLTTMGERPMLGRDIRRDEGEEGGPTVVVLTHRFWQERMGEDPEVLGTTIQLAGRAYEVIGVAPEGFAYPRSVAMWIPGQWPLATHDRGRHFLRVVGRLAPGATIESAQAELSGIATRMEEENPETNRARGIHLLSLKEETVGDVRKALFVLLGAVSMVLLIACANVANLLLVRGAARVKEVAVRATLGAGRGAILRQIMAESVVLSFVGSGLGVLLAVWGVSGLKALSPGGIPRFSEVSVDVTVLLFALVLAVIVALLFGLIPAVRLANTSIASVIREGKEERLRHGDRGLARSGLLIAEVALSLVLLLGAGLLLRSFARIQGVELGFDPENVRQFTLTLPQARYEREQWPEFYSVLEERIAAVPGVESVGMIFGSPLGRSHTSIGFDILGRPSDEGGRQNNWLVRVVSPGYFESVRIPLLRGRGLQATDRADAPGVAVISRTAAERIFPGEDPIGQQFRFDDDDPPWTIVGVVGDVRSLDLTTGSYPEAYFSHAQWPRSSLTFTVRRAEGVTGLVPTLRREVGELDPNLAMYYVEMLEQRVERYLASDRFYLVLLGIFAGLAVVLAAVGLYGVVAYLVSRRTREIGIRVALGSPHERVVRLIVGQGMSPVVVGTVIGLVAALAGGRVLSSLLYEVRPWDPLTFLGGTTLLIVIALGAILLPARAALRISPTEAMRVE